jgi:hypothetical protein
MGPALHGTAGPQGGQSHGVIKVGFATKSPRFYEIYTGPKRGDLDAVKATATLINHDQALVLTGKMAGKIDTSPAGVSDQSFYVFGINRGGAAAIGPFKNRPDVRFDAVVVVSVTPSGTTAAVNDLKSGVRTSLPDSALTIRGNTVQVVVPAGLLPSTGVPISQYRVNLWPRSALPPAGDNTIASFVPEFTTFRVAESKR